MRPVCKHGKSALLLNCSGASPNLTMPVFCIENLFNSRQRKCFFDVVKEEQTVTEFDGKGLVCYYSIKAYRVFWIRPALKCFDLFCD